MKPEYEPKTLQQKGDDCPQCGAPTEWGYGLAGGGIGTYRYCTACDYFDKTQDSDDDDE